MYRYDWYIVPEIYNHDVKEEKVVNDFIKILSYLDNSYWHYSLFLSTHRICL
jgi:hypothetical protein